MSETSEVKNVSQAKWRAANPKAVWAQSALRSAIKRGIIKQEQCAVCGSEKSEAHHEDYSRPADVTWLCRQCHKTRHAALKRRAS